MLAAVTSVAADMLKWGPAGAIFQLFGFAVCANASGTSWRTVAIAAGIATASATFAILLSMIGRREHLFRPAPPLPGPAEAWDHFRSDATMRHIVRMGGATLVTGSITTLLGLGHPYWGMVAAAAPLASPASTNQVVRAVHRFIGTQLGLVIAAGAILLLPRGLPMILGIIVFQSGAELFVARNYTLGLLSITPMALLMGQLVHPSTVTQVLWDRGWETLFGVVVSLAFTFLTHADDGDAQGDDQAFLRGVRGRESRSVG